MCLWERKKERKRERDAEITVSASNTLLGWSNPTEPKASQFFLFCSSTTPSFWSISFPRWYSFDRKLRPSMFSLSLSQFFFGLFHKFGIWVLFLLQFYVLGLSNLWYLLDLSVSWIWMNHQKTLEVWSFWKKNMKWDFCGLCVLLKH